MREFGVQASVQMLLSVHQASSYAGYTSSGGIFSRALSDPPRLTPMGSCYDLYVTHLLQCITNISLLISPAGLWIPQSK